MVCAQNNDMGDSQRITAVFGARKGSVRVGDKNKRMFGGNQSLLTSKINVLKSVRGIADIVVSSDCPELLSMAQRAGARAVSREPIHSEGHVGYTPAGFFRHLAALCETDVMMYCPCTTPFLSSEDYEQAIHAWSTRKPGVDSVVHAASEKNFLWHGSAPLNYDADSPPRSQDLPDWVRLTFGYNIIHRELALQTGNIIGRSPTFITCVGPKTLDIDTPTDFLCCSHLQTLQIFDERDASHVMELSRRDTILLDCTIRDGGYLNNWSFAKDFVRDCYTACEASGVDFFEVGFRSNKNLLPGKGQWCYSVESDIMDTIGDLLTSKCRVAVMARVGTVSVEDFIPAQ